ncbi:AAA family ATPase [Sulfurimonas sp. HSL-1656]|uniref:AAA family ATPase n=1 Tax=Thiomicrolovo subterrani TaxID=3131934 RepID=UPI0031F85115
MMEVKSSAITYSGYEYQTLQGVLLLAYWLNTPGEYKRISFEADFDNNEAPQGIDDIVCERTDGRVDYRQVKFTPNPYKRENFFSWEWLLKRTGKTERSRSILKKLSDAITQVMPDKLGEVILVTNKIPDRDIESCLKNGKLNFDLIESGIRSKIVEQLGSEEIARGLFGKLQIQHSDGDYHSILRTARNELERHSDDDGIYRLLERARWWARYKKQPSEDGWIYLHNVRDILSLKRPEPIPESFSIPDSYCLPDETFHKSLLTQIIGSSGDIITLVGPPGRGKSTYLSYLCQELEDKEIPSIRHHYFLSISDQTFDRFSPRIIAESLISQIISNHRDVGISSLNAEDLRSALEQCAAYYKRQEKPFVLIVDGLDHVWRDNDGNKKPLDEFFRMLLPVPDNLILLIGTQPVDESKLPNTLLEHCPKGTWKWLPAMTGNAIYQYLHFQLDSGRLHMNCHEDMVEDEIKKAAEQLITITSGFPLHVIYSCEFLVQNGKPLSSWSLEHLPACENSDITSYYLGLWRRLTHKQKDVLHLCCGFQFIWPRESFTTILNESLEDTPSLYAVSFLLFETKSGVRPFHESLIVFVRNIEEHNARVNTLIGNVCDWLNNQAPEYLKQSWYWLCLAKQGNSIPLREGVSRDWVLDRASEGYSLQMLIRLLENAENIAFKEFHYAEAYRHRVLKTRLLNGPEFQIWDYPTLEMLSLYNASASIIDLELSLYRDFTPKRLAILSIALWQRQDFNKAKDLAKKAIDKHRSQIKFRRRSHRDESDDEAHAIIRAGVLSDVLNYDFVFADDNFVHWSESYIKAFKDACLSKGDIALMMKALQVLGKSSEGREFELAAIRTSILEDSDIFSWQEFLENHSHPASKSLKLLRTRNFKSTEDSFADFENYNCCAHSEISYYEWFFEALAIKLSAEGDFSWLPANATRDDVDISFHLNTLTELASSVSELLMALEEVDFLLMSDYLLEVSFPKESSARSRREEIMFKRDWLKISADIHLFTTQRQITLEELQEAISLEVYMLVWLRLWYVEIGQTFLSDAAATLLLESSIHEQNEELQNTTERANDNLELACIALRHGKQEFIPNIIKLCWDYTIGYGGHKDTTIFNVLDAIECLSDCCPSEAMTLLERISPIVFNITEFTDGDETKHALAAISEILTKLSPVTLASKYAQEVRYGEWYEADTSLSEILKHTSFNSDIVRRFCLTGLSHKCHQILATKVEEHDENAEAIAAAIQETQGIDLKVEDEKNESNTVGEKIEIDPALYPPDHLVELENALAGMYSTYNFWPRWYSYWVEHGREQELLQILPDAISNCRDKLDDKKYLYDLLFDSSKKFNGKKKSFEFLVAAQISMGGWLNWHERQENSRKRLKKVAEIYPDRIDEFIAATTTSLDVWYSKADEQIIPSDKLVYLLVEAGRTEEAIGFIIAMIEKLEEDTRNLNLPSPHWDWHAIDDIDEVFIKLLVSRLKWPVSTIKLWVSQQLAGLLVEMPEKIEDVLLSALSKCEQESECIEVLAVFLIAKDFGYKPIKEIGEFIHTRSVLSEMLIEDLGLSVKGYFAADFEPLWVSDPENNSFEQAQGQYVPLVYKHTLEEEEKKTDIPFSEFYESEWNRTFKYASAVNNEISYFLNSDFEGSTGSFYTNNSHRGRSAFLRVIEIGRKFFRMPDHYAEILAIHALPIEPAYIHLRPIKPKWLPEWTYGNDVTETNLTQFIRQCASNLNDSEQDAVLGALAFPIQIDKDSWVDLTVLRGVVLGGHSHKITFNERMNGFSIGDRLNRMISYHCNELELDDETKVLQLSGTTYPLSRYGYWHSDMEVRGVNVPLTYAKNREIEAYSSNSKLVFRIDGDSIGEFGYWNYKWAPAYPKNIDSLCGTYTTFSMSSLEQWMHKDLSGLDQVFMCKVSYIRRDHSYSKYEIDEQTLVISEVLAKDKN